MTEYATVWKDYPRNTDFYEAMIQTFGKLGPQCLDTTVSLLLEWLPDHSKRHSTLKAANPSYGTIEEYVFPTFLRKVNLDANDNRGMDLVVSLASLRVPPQPRQPAETPGHTPPSHLCLLSSDSTEYISTLCLLLFSKTPSYPCTTSISCGPPLFEYPRIAGIFDAADRHSAVQLT